MPYLTNEWTREHLRKRGWDPDSPQALTVAQRLGLPIGTQPSTGIGGDLIAATQGLGRMVINTGLGIADLPLMAGRAAGITEEEVPFLEPTLTEELNPLASATGSLAGFLPTMFLPGAALGGLSKLSSVSKATRLGRMAQGLGRAASRADAALDSTRAIARVAERGGLGLFNPRTGAGALRTFRDFSKAPAWYRASFVKKAAQQGQPGLLSGLNPVAVGARAVETGVPMGTVGFLQGRSPDERMANAAHMAAFGAVFGGAGAFPGMGRGRAALREGIVGGIAPPPVETGNPLQDRAAGALFGAITGGVLFPRHGEMERPDLVQVRGPSRKPLRILGKIDDPIAYARVEPEAIPEVDQALTIVNRVEDPMAWNAASDNLTTQSAVDPDGYLREIGLTQDQIETLRDIGPDPGLLNRRLRDARAALIRLGLDGPEVDRAINRLGEIEEAKNQVIEAARQTTEEEDAALQELSRTHDELIEQQQLAASEYRTVKDMIQSVKDRAEATNQEIPQQLLDFEAYVDAEQARRVESFEAGRADIMDRLDAEETVADVESASPRNEAEQQDYRVTREPDGPAETEAPTTEVKGGAFARRRARTGRGVEAQKAKEKPKKTTERVPLPEQSEAGRAIWEEGELPLSRAIHALQTRLSSSLQRGVVVRNVEVLKDSPLRVRVHYSNVRGDQKPRTLDLSEKKIRRDAPDEESASEGIITLRLAGLASQKLQDAAAADGFAKTLQRMEWEQNVQREIPEPRELAQEPPQEGRTPGEGPSLIEYKTPTEESHTEGVAFKQLHKEIKDQVRRAVRMLFDEQYLLDRTGEPLAKIVENVALDIQTSSDPVLQRLIRQHVEQGEPIKASQYFHSAIRDEIQAYALGGRGVDLRRQIDWRHGTNRNVFAALNKIVRAFNNVFGEAPRFEELDAIARDGPTQNNLRQIAEDRGKDFDKIRQYFREGRKVPAGERSVMGRFTRAVTRKQAVRRDVVPITKERVGSEQDLISALGSRNREIIEAYKLDEGDIEYILNGPADAEGGQVVNIPPRYPQDPVIDDTAPVAPGETPRIITGTRRMYEILDPHATGRRRFGQEVDSGERLGEGETGVTREEVAERAAEKAGATPEDNFADRASLMGVQPESRPTSERAVVSAIEGRPDAFGETAPSEAQLSLVAQVIRQTMEAEELPPSTVADVISRMQEMGLEVGVPSPKVAARIAQILGKMGFEAPQAIGKVDVDPNLFVYDHAFRTHEQAARELRANDLEGVPREFVEAEAWALERGTKLSAIDNAYRLRVQKGMTTPEIEQALYVTGKYSRGEARTAAQIVTSRAKDTRGRVKSRLPKAIEQVKDDPAAIPEVVIQRLEPGTKGEAINRIVETELANRPRDPNVTRVDDTDYVRRTEEEVVEKAAAEHRKKVRAAERDVGKIERERRKAVDAIERAARKERQAQQEVRRKLGGRLRAIQSELSKLQNRIDHQNERVRQAAKEGNARKLEDSSKRLSSLIEEAETARGHANALRNLQATRELLFENRVVESLEEVEGATRVAVERAQEAPAPEEVVRYREAKDFLRAMNLFGKEGMDRTRIAGGARLGDALPWRLFLQHNLARINSPEATHPTNPNARWRSKRKLDRIIDRAKKEGRGGMFPVSQWVAGGKSPVPNHVARQIVTALQHTGWYRRFDVQGPIREGVNDPESPYRMEVTDKKTGETAVLSTPEQASLWIDFQISGPQTNGDPPHAVRTGGHYSGLSGPKILLGGEDGPNAPIRDYDMADGEGGDIVPPSRGAHNPIETVRREVREETVEQNGAIIDNTGEGSGRRTKGRNRRIELNQWQVRAGLPLRILDSLERQYKNLTGKELGLKPLVRHAIHMNNFRFHKTNEALKFLDRIRKETNVGMGRKAQWRIGQAARVLDEVSFAIQRTEGVEAARERLNELRAGVAHRFNLSDAELSFMVRVQDEYLPWLFREFDIPAEEVIGYFPRLAQDARALKHIEGRNALQQDAIRQMFEPLEARSRVGETTSIEEASPLSMISPTMRQTYLDMGIPLERIGENFLQVMSNYTRAGYKNKYVRSPVEQIHTRARAVDIGSGGEGIFGPAVDDLVGQAINRLVGQRGFDPAKASSADRRIKLGQKIIDYAEKLRPYTPERVVNSMTELARSFGINAATGDFRSLFDTYTAAHRASVFGLHVMRAFRDFTTTNFFFVAPRLGLADFAYGFKEVALKPKQGLQYIRQLRAEGTIPDDMLQGLPQIDEAGGFVDTGNERLNRILHAGSQYGPKVMTGLYRKADVMTRAIISKAMERAVPRELAKYKKTTNKAEAFEEFIANTGLDTYDPGGRADWERLIERALETGDEAGLIREISRIHQEGTVFEYSLPASPRFYDSPPMRFLGQYGTWSMNAVNSMYWAARGPFSHHTNMRRALTRSAKIWGTYALAAELVYSAGATLFDTDTSDFIPFLHNFWYAGGPGFGWIDVTRDLLGGDPILHRRLSQDPVDVLSDTASSLIPIPASDVLLKRIPSQYMDNYTKKNSPIFGFYDLYRQRETTWGKLLVSMGFNPYSKPLTRYQGNVFVEGLTYGPRWVQDQLSEQARILAPGSAQKARWHDSLIESE